MSYQLQTIEISCVEMAPELASSYQAEHTGASKKATYTLVGFKLLELCLIICCIGLIDEPSVNSHIRVFISPRVVALCYVTFGALIIYTSIYLIMAVIGDITPWRTATLWALIAFVLYVAVTILLFRDWSATKDRNYWHPNMQRLDLVLGAASVSLVACIIYLIDMLVTVRYGVRGDLE